MAALSMNAVVDVDVGVRLVGENFCVLVLSTIVPPRSQVAREGGFPKSLPPMGLLRVASSWCPGFFLRQVALVCSGCTREPCDQQYPPWSL